MKRFEGKERSRIARFVIEKGWDGKWLCDAGNVQFRERLYIPPFCNATGLCLHFRTDNQRTAPKYSQVVDGISFAPICMTNLGSNDIE
jgi:hypothetical protein